MHPWSPRAVVARVCDRFGAMCDLLLPPGLRVALHEAAQEGEGGSSVEGGRAAHASTGAGAASAAAAPPRLILRFKRSKAGEGLEEAPWLESLEQLSGGQRTLVRILRILDFTCVRVCIRLHPCGWCSRTHTRAHACPLWPHLARCHWPCCWPLPARAAALAWSSWTR